MERHALSLFFATTVCLLLIAGCGGAPQAAPPTAAALPPTPMPVLPSPTLAPPTPTAEPAAGDVPEILLAFRDAVNGQDADRILALFVDAGLSYAEVGFASATDRSTLRDYWESQFGVGAQIREIRDCTLKEDTWSCTQAARDDCYVVYGIQESQSDLTVKIKDGKIQTMILTPPAEAVPLVQEKLSALFAWTQANRPDDWKIMNSGELPRAVGEAYSRACKSYAATLK